MVVAQEKLEWQQPLKHVSTTPKKANPIKKRNRSHWKSIMALGLTVAVAGVIGAETINLTVVKGAEIRALEKEITAIKSQNDVLQVEVDKLRSVSRIETAALSMGMQKPSGTVYVAGNLPAVKSKTGTSTSQVATEQVEEKPSAIKQLSQLFTSFFASTQR
ncbi:MAG: septum formation initiator [Desulfitobacterium hafniense]|nr:septum formation initiator [Desulfitobacterium hafniense]